MVHAASLLAARSRSSAGWCASWFTLRSTARSRSSTSWLALWCTSLGTRSGAARLAALVVVAEAETSFGVDADERNQRGRDESNLHFKLLYCESHWGT